MIGRLQPFLLISFNDRLNVLLLSRKQKYAFTQNESFCWSGKLKNAFNFINTEIRITVKEFFCLFYFLTTFTRSPVPPWRACFLVTRNDRLYVWMSKQYRGDYCRVRQTHRFVTVKDDVSQYFGNIWVISWNVNFSAKIMQELVLFSSRMQKVTSSWHLNIASWLINHINLFILDRAYQYWEK